MFFSSLITRSFVFVLDFSLGNLPPVFTSDLSPLLVEEDTPVGTKVLTLSATDPENGRVTYGLQGSKSLRVDPHTGDVIIIQPLDREVSVGMCTSLRPNLAILFRKSCQVA